jgi:hypothetical protein
MLLLGVSKPIIMRIGAFRAAREKLNVFYLISARREEFNQRPKD